VKTRAKREVRAIPREGHEDLFRNDLYGLAAARRRKRETGIAVKDRAKAKKHTSVH